MNLIKLTDTSGDVLLIDADRIVSVKPKPSGLGASTCNWYDAGSWITLQVGEESVIEYAAETPGEVLEAMSPDPLHMGSVRPSPDPARPENNK